MKPINIYFLTQFSSEQTGLISDYKATFTDCQTNQEIKPREYETLCGFVNEAKKELSISDFDGFYFSYTISQIGKEFDLLKLSDKKVVNIELKSEQVDQQKILDQLLKNKYYLSHLPGKHYFFTYVKGSEEIYRLTDDESLSICSIETVLSALHGFDGFFTGDIDEKFRPSQFLVSPVNTPEKFLSGKYFLNLQQREFSNRIEALINENVGKKATFVYVNGGAGTGKTLLLYHLAKSFAKDYHICILHCGPLSANHERLQKLWPDVKIIMPKEIETINISQYDIFFVDESQRIYPTQLDKIINEIQDAKKVCVFGMDPKQVLSRREQEYKNHEKIKSLPGVLKFSLSEKVRTNKEMSDFIDKIVDGKKTVSTKHFKNIEVCYAKSYEEAKVFLDYYNSKGYQYISYTRSLYAPDSIDLLQSEINTHRAVGQEFDRVVITLDGHFGYNEKKRLTARSHPNPDYIFDKLFYQGITRTREKLALIVIDNLPVFSQIISILKASENI